MNKKEYSPTAEQRRAIEAEGRVIVSAAAGSGKTATLIKRILRHISDGAQLERMLILVYNNAAASELKEKLYLALFDAARDASGERRELFVRAQDRIGFAHIGTIHSFCQSLIRDNFEKAGLSPSFEVLGKQAHDAYIRRALDNVFARLSEENDGAFITLNEIFSSARKEDNLRKNIIKLYEMTDVQPDPEAFILKISDLFQGFEDGAYVKAYLSSLKKLFRRAAKECGELIEPLVYFGERKYADNVINLKRACEDALDSDSLDELIKVCVRGVDQTRTKCSHPEAELFIDRAKCVKNEVVSVMGRIKEALSDVEFLKKAHAQNADYARELIRIVKEFSAELSTLKQADNALSFGDLEHYAARLLKEENDFDKDYDLVFVDEYQDVNPVQEFIISRMSGVSSFMVGDVKQSIYGFRLADPEIFLARRKRYAAGEGCAIEFTQNFRSAKNILSFVNEVFNAVMTEESSGVDYKRRERFDVEKAPDGGACELHLFGSSSSGKSEARGVYDITKHENPEESESASEAEGRFIAETIRSLVGKAKGSDGFIGYKDIAVLFRYNVSGAKKIVKTLKEEGIPVDGDAFSSDTSSPENELMLFLKVIDNPKQDVLFAGFLLSFFGGFDEDDLARIATYDGDCFYDKARACSKTPDELGGRLESLFYTLDKYRLKAGSQSVKDLMRTLISDFSYDAYLRKRGESCAYALDAFVSGVSDRSNGELSRFIKAYDEAERESYSASGGGERVTVSTFHSFKGLEREVIFVADAAAAFYDDSAKNDFIADHGGFVGLEHFDGEKRTKRPTLSKETTARLIKERATRDEMRLLYVALTRARSYLYITASAGADKLNSFGNAPVLGFPSCDLDFLSQAVFEGSAHIAPYRHTAKAIERDIELKKSGYALLSDPDEELTRKIASARRYVYPHAEASTLSMKYSVSALDGLNERTVGIFAEAAETGTAYHKVMENIEFGAKDIFEVEAEIKRMVGEGALFEEEAALVKPEEILRCLKSDIIRLASRSVCMREKAFIMYAPANEVVPGASSSDKVLVQGVVDLFITGEKNIIVDFKNSALRDEEALKKYKKQLYLYKNALENAFNVKIDKVALYSFKTGRTHYL